MFRKLIQLFFVLVASYSGIISAVGLGDYKLYSGLNQPFNAEIKLLSVADLAEHELTASLASNQEFQKVGVERLFVLNELRFAVVKNAKGQLIIKASSRKPIKEPFLNFLVELNWPNGRIIREYTFLLDPPIFDKSTSSTIQKAETSQPVAQTSRQQSPASVAPSSVPSKKNSQNYTGSSYTVSANDTLWGIASRTRSNNVSIQQMLVAIYRDNPDAFIDGNINKLARGEVLTIPDVSDAAKVPHRAALQDVVMQNKQWRSSGGARQIVDNSKKSSSSSQISEQPRLSLAAPSSGSKSEEGSGSGYSKELSKTKEQLVNVQEKSATLQAENDELRARLNDVLKKLEETQSDSAINLEDTELAVLTQSQEELATTQESQLAEESLAEENKELSEEDSSLLVESEEAGNEIVESKVSTQDVNQSVANTKKPSLTKQPAKPQSFIDGLLASGKLMWGAIIGLVVLIVIAVFWGMRKRMQAEDFQEDLVASTGANTADSAEDFELPEVGDDMLVQLDMDDEAEKKVESENETFDALGEADIYIAYGKYDEAEKLLQDAISDNPIRSDLKVKLMECYVEGNNKEVFEELAIEVSQAVDADEWLPKVKEMREQAWSGQGGEEDFDLPSTEDIFGEKDESDFTAELNDEAEEVDFDLTEATEDSIDDEFSLDETDNDEEEFDVSLDLPDDTDEEQQENLETFDSIDDDELSLDDEPSLPDEDNTLDGLDAEVDLDKDVDLDSDIDLNDDDFSFDDEDFTDADDEDSGDEISTKLDLARAYIDMGDSEGAQEILSEVLSEGTDDQKEQAQSLLDKVN